MATINLGAIKFNWKGAYNSGTSYAVDDVVSSGGNSYVCIQAHSNQAVGNATAYWNIMSSAGTNGTDLSTTLNNKEIAFKTNAGAVDGIPIGTAGQALKVNSGATGYEFGSVAGGKVLQYVSISDNNQYGTNTGTTPNAVQGTNADLTITPSATSSRILVSYNWGGIHTHEGSNLGYGKLMYNVGGGSFGDVAPIGINSAAGGPHHFKVTLEASSYAARPITFQFIHHPNTTSEVKYRPYFWTESSTGYTFINRSARDNGNDAHTVMFAHALELA